MAFLSIVIPTLNRPSYLLNTVGALLDQSYGNFEIIIVDQSENDVVFLSDKDRRITHLRQVEKSASKARNTGLRHSNGDIVLFLDDDIIIDYSDFLSNHIRHYSDSSCPGVSGAILSTEKEFKSNKHSWSNKKRVGWLFFPINYNRKVPIRNGWAGNLSVRRDWAIKVGGMDEQYEKGAFREESDFCTRLVKRYGDLIYDPEAYIIHIGAQTGGLRSFSTKSLVKAQHHFDGMFYYLFRNVKIIDYPYHIIAFAMIFFKWRQFIKAPVAFLVFFQRSVLGVFHAISKIIQGPKILAG